jgi:hypothetical protein
MSGEQDFERLEQRRRLFGALQYFGDLSLVAVRHCGDDRLFVFEIAIDQPDADPGLSADIVHARLMKTTLGEANKGRIKDLTTPIWNGICWGLRHRIGTMNERSFIVKSAMSAHYS